MGRSREIVLHIPEHVCVPARLQRNSKQLVRVERIFFCLRRQTGERERVANKKQRKKGELQEACEQTMR